MTARSPPLRWKKNKGEGGCNEKKAEAWCKDCADQEEKEEKNVNKFLGVGLKTATMLAIFTILFILGGKVISAKYPVKGITEVFHAI